MQARGRRSARVRRCRHWSGRMRLRLLGDRARELHDERERVQSLLVDGACSRAAGLNRGQNIGRCRT